MRKSQPPKIDTYQDTQPIKLDRSFRKKKPKNYGKKKTQEIKTQKIDTQFDSKGESQNDLEELKFWQERSAKFENIYFNICNLGLPNLHINTQTIPHQVKVIVGELKQTFQKNQEITLFEIDKRPQALGYIKQIISVIVEGHEAIGIYHLLRNTSQFFKNITELSIDEECLLQILCSIKEVITIPFKISDKSNQFIVHKLFQTIEVNYDERLYDGCQFNQLKTPFFQVSDPALLLPWESMKNIQLNRSLRNFILEYAELVKKFLQSMEIQNLTQASELYEQIIAKKKIIQLTKQSPMRQTKESQILNESSSESKRPLLNTQLFGQRTLKDFYKEKIKKQLTIIEEENIKKNTRSTIFRNLAVQEPRISQDWDHKRLNEFETWLSNANKINQYYLTLEDHLQLKQTTRKEQKQPRRKYFMIYDSQKHLNGCILTKNSTKIKPKQPFYKDEEIIDYDLDSEIEVQELLAVDVSLSGKSSGSDTDSVNSEDQKFIADNQINANLLKEYNINKTYNQMLNEALTTGNYQPFQLIRKKAESSEVEDYFHKYMINPLSKEDHFPISIEKQKHSDLKKKQENYFENNDNLKDLLLFTHGKIESKTKLAQEYVKLNPAARNIHANRKISEFCVKDSKKRYLIQDRILDLLQLTKDAEKILNEREKQSQIQVQKSVFMNNNTNEIQNQTLSQVLQGGTNLFQNILQEKQVQLNSQLMSTQELFSLGKQNQFDNYEQQ